MIATTCTRISTAFRIHTQLLHSLSLLLNGSPFLRFMNSLFPSPFPSLHLDQNHNLVHQLVFLQNQPCIDVIRLEYTL